MNSDFTLFVESLRKYSLNRKNITTDDSTDESDISNFLFAHTQAGKDILSITAVREWDSKTDPSKKAGDLMTLTGRLGACKGSHNISQTRNPNLDTKVQYARNGVLRLCVTRNGRKVTRSFKVGSIKKIVMGGDTWIPKI